MVSLPEISGCRKCKENLPLELSPIALDNNTAEILIIRYVSKTYCLRDYILFLFIFIGYGSLALSNIKG